MTDQTKNINVSRRRKFLKQIGLGAAAIPVIATGSNLPKSVYSLPVSNPADEDYWKLVKQQFAIPNNMMMANSANLCPCPRFVNDRVRQFQENLNRDVSFQNRSNYAEIRSKSLKMLADFLGITKKEIGITRNTSESNNIVVNGLDLKKGDEVIIWDQNHPTNRLSWKQRGKRLGFDVKEINVPLNPEDKADLIKPFEEAITSKTKVIAFSHLSNVSGILMPVKEICSLAASRNIMTLIDGAQTFGNIDINLSDLGCDFYSSSTHKWLMGPMESGILYVKQDRIPQLWPDSIAPGWAEDKLTVDEKYCALGQRNNPTIASIPDILEFHTQIGKKNIENRIIELHQRLKSQLNKNIPGIKFTTPMQQQLSSGVTIFNVEGQDFREVFQKLYADFGVASAPMNGIRLSPTIMNTLKDMDRLVDAVKGSLS